MTKATVSDFVRDAVREKATRELVALNQRIVALDGVERVKDAIAAVATDLGATASAIAALPPEPSLVVKLRRLRKAIEEAQSLSSDIAEALSIDEQRSAAEVSRASILRALADAGLDPELVVRPAAE